MSILKKTAKFLTLCLIIAALASCGGKKGSNDGAVSKKPVITASLMIVTIDTWRWDYIGISGRGRVATPNLDRLAEEGIYDPETETPYPLTTPAHASIMTGTLPLNHGVLDCIHYKLPESLPTLAESFKKKGFQTAAFVSSLSLDKSFGLDRGFDLYDQSGMDFNKAAAKDGSLITEGTISFIQRSAPDAGLFVWAHYYDLHMPYRDRPEFSALYPGDPYAAQASFVDGEVGKLFGAMAADKTRNWRIIIVGDHGEGLGGHDEMGHGLALYRDTQHVPLVVWPEPEKKMIHPRPWSLQDIYPTVLSWFDLPQTGRVDGEDLFSIGTNGRSLASFTIQPCFQFGINPVMGVRKNDWMYMRHGTEELYSLDKDPDEMSNLSGSPEYAKILAELRFLCDRDLPLSRIGEVAERTTTRPADQLESLKGLGYVDSTQSGFGNLQRADIRQACRDEAMISRAKEQFKKDGDSGTFRKTWEQVLQKYPNSSNFCKEYGEFLLGERDAAGAMRVFEKAVQLNGRDPMILDNLAGLYLISGKINESRKLFESALMINEADPVAHKNLGIIFAGYLKDQERAVSHYSRYLELGGDGDREKVKEYLDEVRRIAPPVPGTSHDE